MKPIPSLLQTSTLALGLCLTSSSARAAEGQIDVRLGTIIPTGTSYHRSLVEMGEKWRKASGGTIKLTLYPDGRQGGEAAMVRKMRSNSLNAGMFSVVGLSEIDDGVTCLQKMPMTFRTWEEVDYVREKIRPVLERRLQAKGYEVLFWADAGWVRFFSTAPGVHPADFQRMKMFVWSGDEPQMELMKKIGYQPRALETADILPGLSTGLIDAVPMPPFIALAGQLDGKAKHMLDVNWVPIVGAAVIKKETWDKIPYAQQKSIREAASAAGEQIRNRGRIENDESVKAMQKRGLKVQTASPEVVAEWQQLAAKVYPEIRGKMVPAELFDQVQRLLQEHRAISAKQTKN